MLKKLAVLTLAAIGGVFVYTAVKKAEEKIDDVDVDVEVGVKKSK